ncbi:hypothetical protein B0H15DRAFT_800553 [Mycena belliarum]|uniref:Uncharacterized protein n=1 Tax=Mycena belliarum TaxID=1033014 RepID=A0AAD6XMK7_9AGAR|nr:hypothetical protein B0H15DRAFT_800553 [Mycena belliae]
MHPIRGTIGKGTCPGPNFELVLWALNKLAWQLSQLMLPLLTVNSPARATISGFQLPVTPRQHVILADPSGRPRFWVSSHGVSVPDSGFWSLHACRLENPQSAPQHDIVCASSRTLATRSPPRNFIQYSGFTQAAPSRHVSSRLSRAPSIPPRWQRASIYTIPDVFDASALARLNLAAVLMRLTRRPRCLTD